MTGLDIEITPEARDWVARQGGRVYVADDLRVEHPLTVRLEGVLGFRRLFVDGVELAADR